jgi:hypothetical protein
MTVRSIVWPTRRPAVPITPKQLLVRAGRVVL